MRERWHLLLAAVVGLATAVYVYDVTAPAGIQVPVVVAAQDIPPFTRIEAGMVKLVTLPEAAVHPNALRDTGKAVGQLAIVPIQQKEQILGAKLAGARGSGLAAALGEEEMAMFVPLETGRYPASFLSPGQRADLVFVAPTRPGTPGFSRLLLSGLRILQVERDKLQPFGDPNGGRLAGITVAVRPDQAERIAYALEHGRVHVLASGSGTSRTGSGVTWENLFHPSPHPSPALEAPVTLRQDAPVVEGDESAE